MSGRARWSNALFALLALVSVPTSAQTISGPAKAIDGDTLDMTGTRVRLFGIDAPEKAQTCQRNGTAWNCGEAAKTLVETLISGKQVECVGRETDVYGRLVAACTSGGLDLGRSVVEGGLAVALQGPESEYGAIAERARGFRLGIWGSDFKMPSDWRAEHPQEARPVRAVATVESRTRAKPQVYRNQFGCAIKGNRNRRGEWIYHLPGMPYYDQTRPEELFCTEAQALAAGYRRSKA
ncbi:hypothetical protein B2G71_20890 [Novosphingobium sp. PC22D]|uniref:thermonuclease family protein n=1 Tax=Novosphingobium sp. PC22D TaxID=1962403 RepID=UPI000BFADE91|nr:thermonuclease family protein [Novosphingobium sp. PC22D]PEQ10763.1 hypothetical protein B2G71_20890 [Novosphingobium sp. PC22D]